MPTYEFEIGGRTYEVQSDRMPTAAQMRSIASRMGGGERRPARPEDFTPTTAPQGSAAGRFARGAWEMVNPAPLLEQIPGALTRPIQTQRKIAEGIVGAQVDQGRKALGAARGGRYLEAAGYAGAALLPIVGPIAADIGEQIGQGDIAGGLGKATGLIGPMAAARPAAAAAQKTATRARDAVRGVVAPADEVADAARWALEQGVPVDAATVSGNRVVRAAKDLADRTVGGSLVGGKASRMRQESMARLGRDLAQKASPTAATPETAGAAVRGGVETLIRKEAGLADDAYARVRELEAADPSKFAVPVKDIRPALQPIFDRLMRKKELTGSLMGDEGRAAQALDALLTGPDAAPLSIVDAALGDLKSAARGAAMPELRTSGQGIAAKAVKELETVLQQRAKDAGVWDDLRAGRDATIAKWTASETLDALKREPVRTFDALTRGGDTAIEQLRDVKKLAPAELPKIGRAYLDELLTTATAEGGFGREAKLWADWQRMGPETKAMLFPDDGLRANLDDFFRIGKRMAENANPSGSGYMVGLGAQGALLIADPVSAGVSALGSAAVSKLLNSPKTARLLLSAMQTPATAPAARSLSARLRVALQASPAAAAASQESARASRPGTPATSTR